MKEIEIKLPKLGESIVQATIVNYFKKENEFIKKDDALLEVATDKVNSEIPSPISGKIKKLIFQVGDLVQVGDPIAIIEATDDLKEEKKETTKKENIESTNEERKNFFSPLILRLAKEKDITMEELNSIQGSGEGSRITKQDIENFKKIKKTTLKHKVIKPSTIRKAIAKEMQKSKNLIPHAYLVDEVDVTNLLEHISKNKNDFLNKNHFKLTITSYICYSIANAIKKYELLNSSFLNDEILVYEDVNLGLAISVEDVVMLPVIKNLQNLSITDIAKKISILKDSAMSKKIQYDDAIDGTITLTNFGMANTMIGFPIIKSPEAAIIGIGAIKDKVILINEKPQNRKIINITLSFDHRIFDGIYACNFLNEIKTILENGHTIPI